MIGGDSRRTAATDIASARRWRKRAILLDLDPTAPCVA